MSIVLRINISHPASHLFSFGNGLVIGKAIMLEDIIDNLKMNSNYYQQTNLSFTVKELDPLFKLFVESGKIQLDS